MRSLTIAAPKVKEYKVRNMAAWAFSKITGQSFGGDLVRGREASRIPVCRGEGEPV